MQSRARSLIHLGSALLVAAVTLRGGAAWAESADASAHHRAHPYHAAVFAGVSAAEAATGPAVGVDLERRIGRVGGAILVDVARMHGATQVIVAPAVVVHPWRGSKVLAAVGWEHGHGHDVVVIRAGAGYDAHLGALSVGPAVAVDRADGATTVVVGAAIGAGF